jgi:CBS domain-containing protein
VYFAEQLISCRVVIGFPEQRLAYLAPKILECNAHYCAVLKPKTYALLGLIRFSEVVANPSTATRIFSDLMRAPPTVQVYENDPIESVIELLAANNPTEVVVIGQSAEFIGLITPDSAGPWLLACAPSLRGVVEKLPGKSRWNSFLPPLPGGRL